MRTLEQELRLKAIVLQQWEDELEERLKDKRREKGGEYTHSKATTTAG